MQKDREIEVSPVYVLSLKSMPVYMITQVVHTFRNILQGEDISQLSVKAGVHLKTVFPPLNLV